MADKALDAAGAGDGDPGGAFDFVAVVLVIACYTSGIRLNEKEGGGSGWLGNLPYAT